MVYATVAMRFRSGYTRAIVFIICVIMSYWMLKRFDGVVLFRREAECPDLHFASEELPLTALASYAGSGNTWVRHLIQQATGLYTGAVYRDPDLQKNGFPGEGLRDGSVVAIKTHKLSTEPRHPNYTRALLIIRSPFDAIVSEFNRLNNDGHSHTGSASMAVYKTDKWESFARRNLHQWHIMNLSWLQTFTGPVHVIIYEDLRRDLARGVEGLARFLRVSPTYVDCAVENAQGEFKRKMKRATDHQKLFSVAHMAVARRNILDVHHALRSANHVTMSSGLPSQYNLIQTYKSAFGTYDILINHDPVPYM